MRVRDDWRKDREERNRADPCKREPRTETNDDAVPRIRPEPLRARSAHAAHRFDPTHGGFVFVG